MPLPPEVLIAGSAQDAVRVALTRRLTADPQFMVASKGLYDLVVPDWDGTKPLPYVVLENVIERSDDRLDTTGNALSVLYKIYSNYSGTFEVTTIMDHIIRLTVRRESSLYCPGWVVTQCILEHTEIFQSMTINGVLRLGIRMQPTRLT